jgi:hypothetical protein
MSETPAKKLIIIPIAHTADETGSLAVRPKTTAQRIEFERKQNVIKAAWREIENNLLGWRTDFSGVFIYQDGLPVLEAGKEIDFVRRVAETGSPNFALLLKLHSLNAQIIGTESPELLEAELNLQKKIQAEPENGELLSMSARILQQRDEFIAKRISDTLPLSASGILFIGLLHSVEKFIPDNIEIFKGKLV